MPNPLEPSSPQINHFVSIFNETEQQPLLGERPVQVVNPTRNEIVDTCSLSLETFCATSACLIGIVDISVGIGACNPGSLAGVVCIINGSGCILGATACKTQQWYDQYCRQANVQPPDINRMS